MVRYGLAALVAAEVVLAGCAARGGPAARPLVPLVAGVGEQIADGVGSTPCTREDSESRQRAVHVALENAVDRASAMYGERAGGPLGNLIVAHRVERYWQGEGQCFAAVQAVIRSARLRETAKNQNREELRGVGRPVVAFAVSSYRILPSIEVTTRRAAAEAIDGLQQELIVRGFDVGRSLRARGQALARGASEVADISSVERAQISSAALKDGVAFLVQGEIKVVDLGKQPDGQYLVAVDGSLEAVDLRTERLVGSFVDEGSAKHISATAAYTKAISAFARSAASGLAPQMLDTWKHAGQELSLPRNDL